MTAPRTCRRCNAALPADVRWCARCFEPVRELSPRAPLHNGDFAGLPIHEGGDIPRWTRWQATATTFGPWGRVITTVLLFAMLIPAVLSGGFVYAISLPVLATVLVREIWAKGWYVPGPHSIEGRPSANAHVSKPEEPGPRAISVTTVLRWGLGIAGVIAFTYGPIEVKASVVGFAGIALLIWLWGVFDR